MPFEIKSETATPSYTIVPKKYRKSKLAAKYLATVAAIVSLNSCVTMGDYVDPYTFEPQISKDSAISIVNGIFDSAWGSSFVRDSLIRLEETVSLNDSTDTTVTLAFEADGYDTTQKVVYEMEEFPASDTAAGEDAQMSADEWSVFYQTTRFDDHEICIIAGRDSASIAENTRYIISYHRNPNQQ